MNIVRVLLTSCYYEAQQSSKPFAETISSFYGKSAIQERPTLMLLSVALDEVTLTLDEVNCTFGSDRFTIIYKKIRGGRPRR